MNLNSAKMMTVPLYCPKLQKCEDQSLLDECLATSWIQRVHKPQDEPFLIIENGMIGLADPLWPKVHPVFVDFLTGATAHRRLHGGGAGQAVAKAVGLNKKKQLRILDATAGLGRDSFVMATLGANVLMFERNPVVYLLLRNGLDRLAEDGSLLDITKRLKLSKTSLVDNIEAVKTFSPEVIYLDPMFPERSKSAKVKKDMALFHGVVGADEDADSLLAPALEIAECRVVIKRPKHAPELDGHKPTTALVGKSSRFDIYSKKAIG